MSYTQEDKINYIVSIYCPIRKVAFETGMSWKTMLAQAAQETGWGKSFLKGTNNVFNIKYDGKWKGKTKTFNVWEGKEGAGITENSKFIVYESKEEAVYDRVNFLKRNPRYSKIFSKDVLGNFEKEVQILEDAGYASHADKKTGELIYAELLLGVFGPTMRKAIARAEEKANCVITAAVFKKGVSGELLANTKVLIKTDNNKYIDKKTNGKGIIEGITSNVNGSINFNLDSKEFSHSVANKRKLAIEVNITNDKFVTKTVNHVTTDNKPTDESKSTTTNNSESSTADSKNSNNVTFNIKLIEGDTGKPLSNTTYHLEYKNNIKPHKTDSSGIESGIKADVSQSIGVYLDDDGGKKQSIYSMSFPVTSDLNGQTKVLKVPVVTLQLIFVDKNKTPVSNYEFKTVYRGRTSDIRKANARGIATVKALAGQQLKVIHVAANKFTSNIVTDGSTEWTYSTDKLIENTSSSTGSTTASNAPSTTISSQKPSPTKPNTSSDVSKGTVIRNDKITQQGPTHEVKTDQARITIKFLDEATNKPLSGLTYWTQSDKYGKNPSTTSSDGTRGRTHDSDVGISIAILVNENGKEIKKGTIVANSDKNGTAYVYKAKKPKVPNVQVLFNNVDRQSIVSQKSKLIIAELAEQCGMSKIYITSTLRTPEEQARAMWGKRSLYGPVGKAVHDVGSNYSQHGEARRTKEMAKAIRSYLDQGKRTSNHCVTFEIYEKLNVVDLGNNSNGFVYYENKKKYLTALGKKFKVACDQAKAAGKIKKYISGDGAEGAFHLEITQ